MNAASADPGYTLLLSTTAHALECLAPAALDDARVHAARKALKNARAALRLLRPRLGASAFERENLALRDAARRLSPLRDARSVLGAIDLLRRRDRRSARDRAAIARLRPLLAARLAAARRALRTGGARADSIEQVRGCRERTQHLLGADVTPAASRDALARIYRKARKAFVHAAKTRTPDALHEYRKQTKYLLTAATALRDSGVRHLRQTCRRADRIASRLGDARDLRTLAETLGATIGTADTAALRKRIDRHCRSLERKALRSGEKLFARAPRRFAARVARPRLAPPPAGDTTLTALRSALPATPAIHCRALSPPPPRADATRHPASGMAPGRRRRAGTGPVAH